MKEFERSILLAIAKEYSHEEIANDLLMRRAVLSFIHTPSKPPLMLVREVRTIKETLIG